MTEHGGNAGCSPCHTFMPGRESFYWLLPTMCRDKHAERIQNDRQCRHIAKHSNNCPRCIVCNIIFSLSEENSRDEESTFQSTCIFCAQPRLGFQCVAAETCFIAHMPCALLDKAGLGRSRHSRWVATFTAWAASCRMPETCASIAARPMRPAGIQTVANTGILIFEFLKSGLASSGTNAIQCRTK